MAPFGKMERDGIAHAALTSHNEYLRRVSLDLTGPSSIAWMPPTRLDKSPEPALVRHVQVRTPLFSILLVVCYILLVSN